MGDMWDRLAELQVGKVEPQKDIPKNQLGEEAISGVLRAQLRRELCSILERWESDRSEASDKTKRPLLNSYDRWGG